MNMNRSFFRRLIAMAGIALVVMVLTMATAPSAYADKHTKGQATVTQVCGNGVKEGSEQCDLGPKNGNPGSTCSKKCETVEDEGLTLQNLDATSVNAKNIHADHVDVDGADVTGMNVHKQNVGEQRVGQTTVEQDFIVNGDLVMGAKKNKRISLILNIGSEFVPAPSNGAWSGYGVVGFQYTGPEGLVVEAGLSPGAWSPWNSKYRGTRFIFGEHAGLGYSFKASGWKFEAIVKNRTLQPAKGNPDLGWQQHTTIGGMAEYQTPPSKSGDSFVIRFGVDFGVYAPFFRGFSPGALPGLFLELGWKRGWLF